MATYRKVGDKWKVEVCVAGKRKSKTLPTKAEVRSWAAKMEVELSLPVAATQSLGQCTLGDVFTRYADEISEHKKGARWEVIRLKKFGSDPLVELLLQDLTREHFEDWRDRRLQDVKPSSVNRELNLISHCLTQARRWRLMSHNPLTDLKRPKNPPHRDRRILDGEISSILNKLNYSASAAVEFQQQRVAIAFLFAIETAMRAGEICALEARYIDLAARTAHLPDTKNGLPRTVPLSSAAVALLEQLRPWPEVGGVFGLASGVLSSLFKRAVDAVGIPNLTFHDSRHEGTTRLSKKMDVLQLARTTGHKDINQLLIYYNETAAELAKLLD